MRRLIFILTPVLAALTLAACGGGSDGGGDAVVSTGGDPAGAVLAAAATNATDAGSSRVSFTVTTDIPGREAPLVITGDGEFDYQGQQGRLTYDLSDVLAAGGLDLGDTEPAEIIVDGTVVYMKFGPLSSLLPGAKDWIKVDVAALGEQEGLDLGQLKQLNQGDPAAILEYLRASGEVEEVGVETLDGVETTHYRATVDLAKAVQQAPAETREQVQAQIDQLEAAGLGELPIDVWVDGDGLPRKIAYDITVKAQGQEVHTVFEMLFTDYGVEVDITPPPADQVTDFSELTALLGATTTA